MEISSQLLFHKLGNACMIENHTSLEIPYMSVKRMGAKELETYGSKPSLLVLCLSLVLLLSLLLPGHLSSDSDSDSNSDLF